MFKSDKWTIDYLNNPRHTYILIGGKVPITVRGIPITAHRDDTGYLSLRSCLVYVATNWYKTDESAAFPTLEGYLNQFTPLFEVWFDKELCECLKAFLDFQTYAARLMGDMTKEVEKILYVYDRRTPGRRLLRNALAKARDCANDWGTSFDLSNTLTDLNNLMGVYRTTNGEVVQAVSFTVKLALALRQYAKARTRETFVDSIRILCTSAVARYESESYSGTSSWRQVFDSSWDNYRATLPKLIFRDHLL